jgi:hypothetical protein
MDFIYMSMNMPRDSSLSTCKVCLFHQLEADIVSWPALFHLKSVCHAGEAESGLERLHQCAEKELQVYLNAEGPSKDFNEFRTKLAGLTR